MRVRQALSQSDACGHERFMGTHAAQSSLVGWRPCWCLHGRLEAYVAWPISGLAGSEMGNCALGVLVQDVLQGDPEEVDRRRALRAGRDPFPERPAQHRIPLWQVRLAPYLLTTEFPTSVRGDSKSKVCAQWVVNINNQCAAPHCDGEPIVVWHFTAPSSDITLLLACPYLLYALEEPVKQCAADLLWEDGVQAVRTPDDSVILHEVSRRQQTCRPQHVHVSVCMR